MHSGAADHRDTFWPTIASLVVVGWIGGLAASLITNAALARRTGLLDPRSPVAYLVISAAVAGLVGALLLPRVLAGISGRSITLRTAFGAVFAGRLAGLCAELAIVALTRSGQGGRQLGLLWIVPLLVQVAVSFKVLGGALERAAAPREVDRSLERWLEAASGARQDVPTPIDVYATALADAGRDVDAAMNVVGIADPVLLERLEARADRLAELDPPEPDARPAQAKLVRGLRAVEQDLRERRRLYGSESVATVRDALAEMRALGLSA
jgi:hypothetical protein